MAGTYKGLKMEYKLEYREGKEKKIQLIDIEFISNKIRRLYNKMIARAIKVRTEYKQIQDNTDKIIALKSERKEGYKEEVKKMQGLNDKSVENIRATGDSDYFEDRIYIMTQLLEKNDIIEERFYDNGFWDECVDEGVMMRFLHEIMNQDVPKKKAIAP